MKIRGKTPKEILYLFHPKSVKRYFEKDLKLREASVINLSLSFSIGAFFSVCPAWGYQAALAGGTAAVFRLNKVAAMAATALSLPPLVPFILLGSFKIGAFLLGETVPPLDFRKFPGWKNLGIYTGQYIIGSFALAVLTGAAVFCVMLPLTFILKRIIRREDTRNREKQTGSRSS